MTNYARGVRYEREVVNLFKDAGYVAQRTAGSHSWFDVVATKKTRLMKKVCHIVILIQCKTVKL